MKRLLFTTIILSILWIFIVPEAFSSLNASFLLRVGSEGLMVEEIQRILSYHSLLSNEPDGIFGTITRGAVQEFQQKTGLTPDGVVGTKTWEFLERSSGQVTPLPLLREGDREPEVLYLKRLLLKQGLSPGEESIHFEAKTVAAVRDFQNQLGLDVDGIVGPATWSGLLEKKESVRDTVEITRDILRPGDQGFQVEMLQEKLSFHFFYHGQIDGVFGPQTEIAVKQFQQFSNLQVDGIVGPSTWEALKHAGDEIVSYYTVKRGDTLWGLANSWGTTIQEIQKANSISNAYQIQIGERLIIPGLKGFQERRVEDIHWDQVNIIFPVNSIAVLTDVETGLSFRVKRLFGSLHADVEPLTAADTATLRSIYGGEWSWERRAVVVQYEDYLIAGSINGFPHGDQSIYVNNFPGHICLHFRGSRLHNSGHMDTDHHNEIQIAKEVRWPLRIN